MLYSEGTVPAFSRWINFSIELLTLLMHVLQSCFLSTTVVIEYIINRYFLICMHACIHHDHHECMRWKNIKV